MVLVLAFVVGIACAAYAEVQNVKVGGDITTVAVTRDRVDLGQNDNSVGAAGLASITRVKVGANLTDNVDVVVRLLNERVWSTLLEDEYDAPETDAMVLDLAYVAFKDFMKDTTNMPLTLVVGRQPIKLGSGLLVGDPDTNQFEGEGPFDNSPIGDLSAKKSFDAIVGILDYSPLTLTLGWVKGCEGDLIQVEDEYKSDDVDVWAVVAAYKFDEDAKNLVLEGTLVRQVLYPVATTVGRQKIDNLGIRATAAPMKDLGVEAEYVYQTAKIFGVFDANNAGFINKDMSSEHSSALRLAATMGFPDAQWVPTLGVDFTRLSEYWNVMHEDTTPADIMNLIFPNQNVQCIGITATAKPKEDLMLKLRYANARMVKLIETETGDFVSAGIPEGQYSMTGKKALGYEIDLAAAYDYTSDVQFGLGFGYFKPGKAFETPRKAATQLIGSMKVTF
jgi:hypothetical protein